MTRIEIDLVARAIHAADKTHSWEPWHEVRDHYRAMAEAAVGQHNEILMFRAEEMACRTSPPVSVQTQDALRRGA